MEKISLFLSTLLLPLLASAQIYRPQEISNLYESVEKKLNANDFETALFTLKRNGGPLMYRSDSLMYLRIKILENLYGHNALYALELDSSLQHFTSSVNRYSFPELKYAEVASIHTSFQYFKEKDRLFYDSVSNLSDQKKVEELTAMVSRLSDYIRATPNSFYRKELAARQGILERKRKKLVDYIENLETLKKVGKAHVFTLGYSVPSGRSTFPGLNNYQEVSSFLDGGYRSSLGTKYSVNASLAGVLFNLYNGARVKAGIVWNIFDAEYTVFDWKNNTLLHEKTRDGDLVEELRSARAGTRVGPMITVLLTRNIAVATYYQARPGVQFLLGEMAFSDPATPTESYTIKPKMLHYNLSNELGFRIYFFKRLFINPFYHFGQFNWQNEIKSGAKGPENMQANYKFSFTGIRIGI